MDTPVIPQGWIDTVFAALLGGTLWLFKKHDKKIDEAALAIAAMSDKYVTREELTKAVDAINAAQAARDERLDKMHDANLRNFSEMRSQLENVNTKLFDLSGRIPK